MKLIKLYLGRDVHKDSSTRAIARLDRVRIGLSRRSLGEEGCLVGGPAAAKAMARPAGLRADNGPQFAKRTIQVGASIWWRAWEASIKTARPP